MPTYSPVSNCLWSYSFWWMRLSSMETCSSLLVSIKIINALKIYVFSLSCPFRDDTLILLEVTAAVDTAPESGLSGAVVPVRNVQYFKYCTLRTGYLFFYLHKVTSVFLSPIFVFHHKFEFSLKFMQRWLVKWHSFVPTLLVGHLPYPAATSHFYFMLFKR